MDKEGHGFKIKVVRRLVQILTVLILVLIPYMSQNPLEWSPSRIVLGHLPEPMTFQVSGDTWSFSAGGLKLTHPLAFIEEVLSSKILYIPLVVSVLIPLFITVFLGRVFCSWFCPVGFLLELNQKMNGFFKRKGLAVAVRIRDYRYVLLSLCLIFGFFFAFPLISVFDPPHVFGREIMYIFTHHTVSISGVGLLTGILAFETFSTSRAWCNYICPSGGALSLLGIKRRWNIRMHKDKCIHCEICNDVCPYYLDPMVLANGGTFDWTKCDNCGLCRDGCPTAAISYSLGKRKES